MYGIKFNKTHCKLYIYIYIYIHIYIYKTYEVCSLHYTILSIIFYHCVEFAHCLLCVRIFHLWTLWILTFLPSHHTISNFLLYYFMIMSFRKCKMFASLHCSYIFFFFFFFTTNPWNHVTYLINFHLRCL